MTYNTVAKEYAFIAPNEESNYCSFPDEIKNDVQVFFHGTAESNLQSIFDSGFEPRGNLNSVSFAKNCYQGLEYAVKSRTNNSPKGCVLAVRFGKNQNSVIRSEHFGIHVDSFDPQPDIIGFYIVPEEYEWL